MRAAVVSIIGSWNTLTRWMRCFLRWSRSFTKGVEIAGVNPAMVTAQNQSKWSECLSKCSSTMESFDMPSMRRTDWALMREFWRKS